MIIVSHYSILFKAVCVLSLQEVALCKSPPTFPLLCYLCPYCSLLPQGRFGLPSLTDPMPFNCDSVLVIVHLLSFIRAMCSARFHFALVLHWTMFVTSSLLNDGVTDFVLNTFTLSRVMSAIHTDRSTYCRKLVGCTPLSSHDLREHRSGYLFKH